MNLTLRQLRVFERVARRLSFTRAAEELFLTQPAVSMQIKQLEEEVGLPLFERLGKKIYLTPAGEAVYQLSRTLLQNIADAEQALEELKGADGGTLKVSVASTVHYFAIRMLADFLRRHPKLSINLQVTNRKGLLKHLESNEVDLVLMGAPPDDHDLIAEPFMDNPLVVIAAPQHPLCARQPLQLSDLNGVEFLMREQGSGTRVAVERYFAEHGIALNPHMEMNSNEAIKQAVELGLGLGIVSLHTIERELHDQRLCCLKVDSFPLLRRWYLVHRTGKHLSKVGEIFKAFVLAEAAQYDQTAPYRV